MKITLLVLLIVNSIYCIGQDTAFVDFPFQNEVFNDTVYATKSKFEGYFLIELCQDTYSDKVYHIKEGHLLDFNNNIYNIQFNPYRNQNIFYFKKYKVQLNETDSIDLNFIDLFKFDSTYSILNNSLFNYYQIPSDTFNFFSNSIYKKQTSNSCFVIYKISTELIKYDLPFFDNIREEIVSKYVYYKLNSICEVEKNDYIIKLLNLEKTDIKKLNVKFFDYNISKCMQCKE